MADYNPDVSDYGVGFASEDALISLVLDSKTAVRLYVQGDNTGEESKVSSTKEQYPTYHEITGLLPQNLADEHTITVGGDDYKFSALSWCCRVLENTNANQKNVNMAKAIVAYYTAAKAYTAPAVKQLTVGDYTFEYQDGDTWQTIVNSGKYSLFGSLYDNTIFTGDYSRILCHDKTGSKNRVYLSDPIDKYTNYLWW